MKSFSAVSSEFSSGNSSPVLFFQDCVKQIEELEPQVRAFEYLNLDRAAQQAQASTERWRNGTQLSSIDGMPVGVKDTIDTADMPTEYGSPIFENHQPAWDSASVQGLKAAGAVLVGKNVTTEFAGPFASKTRNPWGLEHTPGGSSSGSAAAVASGMLTAALGTQVIGSIVRPASYCGVFAIKPSVGAINRGGSHDGLSQSAHGVLGANLADCWNVLREIANRVGGDPGSLPLQYAELPLQAALPTRVGVLFTAGYAIAEPYAKAFLEAVRERLRASGIKVVDAESNERLGKTEQLIAQAREKSLEIIGYESIWPLRSYLDAVPDKLSPTLQDRVRTAEKMSASDYADRLKERDKAREQYASLAESFDVLITLSATGTAPYGLGSTGDTIFNIPASFLGVPTVNLPLHQHEGLPLGLQVMGFKNKDYELLNFAQALWDLCQGV